MSAINLLSNTGYILANKTVAKMFGLDCAVLLGELASEYVYYQREGKLVDGEWFFSTVENVRENTTLSEDRQRKAIKVFEEAGILESTRRGLPAKRYIKINEDRLIEALNSFESLNTSSSGEIGLSSSGDLQELEPVKSRSNNNNNITIINNNNNICSSDDEPQPKKKSTRFVPPTVTEVRAYCLERKNSINPETFVDHYISVGWKVGKNPMKDWKAAVRLWERRDNSANKNQSKPSAGFGYRELD